MFAIFTRGSPSCPRTVSSGRKPSGRGARLSVLTVGYAVVIMPVNQPLERFSVVVGVGGTRCAAVVNSLRTSPVTAEPSALCATGSFMVMRPPPAATSPCQPNHTMV